MRISSTGDANYARVVRETLDYVIRDMTDPAGGFYSTEDADSEGHEGLFYTWTPDEIEAVLGDERGATFGRVYDVSDVGNFEGRNILNLPKTLEQCAAILQRDPAELAAELAESREKLFAAREKRVRPGRDDKVIVAWNGLMIDAMARAGAALNEPEYVITAGEAANFILSRMRHERRPPASHLAQRPSQARCVPRRLCLTRQFTRHPLRSQFQRAMDR